MITSPPPSTRNERHALAELVAFYTPRGDDDTLRSREVIGRMLGISGERVRQIEGEAMRKLRLRISREWRPGT